jgi:phenylpropionate dioxygenase-like ring-hydroxylating dioxygenase large terminal subunit
VTRYSTVPAVGPAGESAMDTPIPPSESARRDYARRMAAAHRPGGPLAGAFYTSADIFHEDMARIWSRYWLYAGHSCQIPRPGDWFTYAIGTDSVIVLRDEKGEIRAFHNTCRHRGSRVCPGETGNSRRLTCPYHSWSYGLDGQLLMDSKADFGLDRSELSLHPVKVRSVAGLVFVALSDQSVAFEDAFADIERKLRPHGLERAKLAHKIDYVVNANWKLIFENNRECYHCGPNHPEYTKATYDVRRDNAHNDPQQMAEIDRLVAEANARFRALGLDEGDAQSVMTDVHWRCRRAPLMKGFTTQSLDGKPVAPLMGDFKERDAGTLRMTIFPNFWQHANDDYACSTRLTPIGPAETHVRVCWYVDREAIEGQDYTLDRLLPVWQRTSEQDWEICQWNQQGVSSSRYVPGRYSLTKEQNVAHFVDWYLREIAR